MVLRRHPKFPYLDMFLMPLPLRFLIHWDLVISLQLASYLHCLYRLLTWLFLLNHSWVNLFGNGLANMGCVMHGLRTTIPMQLYSTWCTLMAMQRTLL